MYVCAQVVRVPMKRGSGGVSVPNTDTGGPIDFLCSKGPGAEWIDQVRFHHTTSHYRLHFCNCALALYRHNVNRKSIEVHTYSTCDSRPLFTLYL